MDLLADADQLPDEERALCEFSITKVGGDKWLGLPGASGVVSTRALFHHVREQMEGDPWVVVAQGKDPRAIKKEMVDQGHEPEQFKFFSIHETIVLNDDDDEENIPMLEMLQRDSKSMYEKVRHRPLLVAPAPTQSSGLRTGRSYFRSHTPMACEPFPQPHQGRRLLHRHYRCHQPRHHLR